VWKSHLVPTLGDVARPGACRVRFQGAVFGLWLYALIQTAKVALRRMQGRIGTRSVRRSPEYPR
jgi:hypothetical protein